MDATVITRSEGPGDVAESERGAFVTPVVSSTLSMVKASARELIQKVIHLFHYGINVWYDCFRIIRYSSVWRGMNDFRRQEAWIRADIHKLEKALSLKSPRPGFGGYIFSRLADNVDRLSMTGKKLDEVDMLWLSDVFHKYVEFQSSHGCGLDRLPTGIIESFLGSGFCSEPSSAPASPEEKYDHAVEFDFRKFAWSRHSIRDFSAQLVERDLLFKAVDMARKTPSVCNRQTTRVHVFDDPVQAGEVLKYQGGNRGFGDAVPAVAIITSDISQFFSPDERNQMWIDGGLFSMSFVYALHSLGLGSCCLNWSVSSKTDRAFRKTGFIPAEESVIMMVAIGHVRKGSRVASSRRLPVDRIATFHSSETPAARSQG